jgi:hypothetical protein
MVTTETIDFHYWINGFLLLEKSNFTTETFKFYY